MKTVHIHPRADIEIDVLDLTTGELANLGSKKAEITFTFFNITFLLADYCN